MKLRRNEPTRNIDKCLFSRYSNKQMTAFDPLQRLNARQRDILHLISKGFHNAEIGRQMNLSERTIKGYISQLFLIFDVTNRTELIGRLLAGDLGKAQGSRSGGCLS